MLHAHGYGYLWRPWLISLHIVSDSLIAGACFAIAIWIVILIRTRAPLPMMVTYVYWSLTFLICFGFVHVVEIITIWEPWFYFSGYLKALTAFVLLGSVRSLIIAVSRLTSSDEGEAIYQALHRYRLAGHRP